MIGNLVMQEVSGVNPYFPEADLQFLHLPRTGGRWRQAALRHSCILRGRWHARADEFDSDSRLAIFVRDPATWTGSLWDFLRQPKSRKWAKEQDQHLWELGSRWTSDIEEFAISVPHGWFDEYYKLATAGRDCMVGRTEHNLEDCESILSQAGLEIPSRARHLSTPSSRPDRPEISCPTKEALRASNPIVVGLHSQSPAALMAQEQA